MKLKPLTWIPMHFGDLDMFNLQYLINRPTTVTPFATDDTFVAGDHTIIDGRKLPVAKFADAEDESIEWLRFAALVYDGSVIWDHFGFRAAIFDLDTIVYSTPILVCLDHSLKMPAGMASDVMIRNGKLFVGGELAVCHEFAAARIIAHNWREKGQRWEISMGGGNDRKDVSFADGWDRVNGRLVPRGSAFLRNFRLKEISFVDRSACELSMVEFRRP